jgi:hypothetical protein
MPPPLPPRPPTAGAGVRPLTTQTQPLAQALAIVLLLVLLLVLLCYISTGTGIDAGGLRWRPRTLASAGSAMWQHALVRMWRVCSGFACTTKTVRGLLARRRLALRLRRRLD